MTKERLRNLACIMRDDGFLTSCYSSELDEAATLIEQQAREIEELKKTIPDSFIQAAIEAKAMETTKTLKEQNEKLVELLDYAKENVTGEIAAHGDCQCDVPNGDCPCVYCASIHFNDALASIQKEKAG